jgi:putative DNA primase/helicase
LAQIQTDTPKIAEKLWRKWLIQAIAAAFDPKGIANAGVMILSGDQGVGKTRLFRDLTEGVPGCFTEGITLNPDDKDSVLNVASHWMVELGELEATFRKADLAQLKAFITRTVDVVRRPYARKESNLPRRTVFAGTVNDLHCLHDPTGNRRFWPLRVNAITRNTQLDYQQLWAEVYSWYLRGETWHLTASEQVALERHCETFRINEPEVEALLEHYPFEGCTTWERKTMGEICRAISLEKPTKAQHMRLAEAIRRHNGGQKPHKSNSQSWHFVPAINVIGLKNPPICIASKPSHSSKSLSEILDKWDD